MPIFYGWLKLPEPRFSKVKNPKFVLLPNR